MSGGEMLLYGYGAVCVCMLIFNVIYIFVQKGQGQRLDKRAQKYVRVVCAQLENVRDGGQVDPKFIRRLRKKLTHVNDLIAYERALNDPDIAGDGESLDAFKRQTRDMVRELAVVYKDREDIEAAYFAYFISRHKVVKYVDTDAVQEIMLEYVRKNSLYCRVNAMAALYSFGTPEIIARAVALMSRMGSVYNEKILTDGLLTYRGDHEKLIQELWARFDSLSDQFRLPVLNYIRFNTGDFCEPMYAIMTDPARDKELRLSAIRYFGRYVYEPARPVLLDFLADKDPGSWEYAAISATCIAPYEGGDVSAALMEAMHSSNWYVRYNASVSLHSRGLDYSDLIEVVGGRDRYAREMMMYRLDSKRLEQEKAKKQGVSA